MKHLAGVMASLICSTALGQAPSPAAAPGPVLRTPTVADAAYGSHPKQRLDFWKADTKVPAPVVVFLHGGAWRRGDRTLVSVLLEPMLEAGISVVSVEYRFIQDADDVQPPVKAPMHDAARAVQFVRSKAAEWNIDKTRVAASGVSAGACMSLWLAFHDDLADPKSSDPVARESTRLLCAAASSPQTSLDPVQMKEWTPNSNYGAHAFGIAAPADKSKTSFEVFLAKRDEIRPWINEYSPWQLVTRDDAPVYLFFPTGPALGQEAKDPTHTANFGVKLQERCPEMGVPCELAYPGAPDVQHAMVTDYLKTMLLAKR